MLEALFQSSCVELIVSPLKSSSRRVPIQLSSGLAQVEKEKRRCFGGRGGSIRCRQSSFLDTNEETLAPRLRSRELWIRMYSTQTPVSTRRLCWYCATLDKLAMHDMTNFYSLDFASHSIAKQQRPSCAIRVASIPYLSTLLLTV